MALAYVHGCPFLTATIIGATRADQLSVNIDSVDLELDTDIIEGIDAVHQRHPNPSPKAVTGLNTGVCHSVNTHSICMVFTSTIRCVSRTGVERAYAPIRVE